MRNCIIGYSGFVGNKISKKNYLKINSKNIYKLKNKSFNVIYCAAPTGKKFLVNKNPIKDFKNVAKLIDILKTVECKKFILISTIDIYQNKTNNINENYIPFKRISKSYGGNRFYLEQFIKKKFENYHIIRLPNLFGKGLEKNFIFDLIFREKIFLNKKSIVQLFNLDKINTYIDKIVKKKIKCINLVSPPIKVLELSKLVENNSKVFSGSYYKYNITTIHNKKFEKKIKYIVSEAEIKKDFLNFYKKTQLNKNLRKIFYKKN